MRDPCRYDPQKGHRMLCVYRETTADSSTKPRKAVDSYCYQARLAALGQDTRVIESVEERRGGGGSLALAKLQIPALVLARYSKLHAKGQS